jgi:hypothetical protein
MKYVIHTQKNMKNKIKIILLLFMILTNNYLLKSIELQNNDKSLETKTVSNTDKLINGSLAISADINSNLYISFLGPSINFNFDVIKLGLNFCPSLKISENPTSKKIEYSPTLGLGPTLNIPSISKNISFIMPVYLNPSNRLWYLSLGLSYKF